MTLSISSRFYHWFRWLIALSALLYVGSRVFSVGGTYDEIWTLTEFSTLSFEHILNYTPAVANNHLLNTILIKLLTEIFGSELWIARLPNLCAFVLYLWSGLAIAKRFFKPLLGTFFLICLVANPFLLEFFGLARGYGLANAFVLVSAYQFLRFQASDLGHRANKSLVFGALAVLSNFTTLPFFLLVFALLILHRLEHRRTSPLRAKELIYPIIILLALFALIYEPIRKLLEGGELYYGGISGVWADSLNSLMRHSLIAPQNELLANWILGVLAAIFGSLLLIWVFRQFREKQPLWSAASACSLLFFGLLVASKLQVVLLGSLYPLDRTILFYHPLAVLSLFFVIREVRFEYPTTNWKAVLAVGLATAFLINTLLHTQLYKTTNWEFDAHSEAMLEYLKGEGKEAPILLDSSWLLERSLGYYAEKLGEGEIVYLRTDHGDMSEKTQYYAFYNKEVPMAWYEPKEDPIHHMPKDTLLYFPEEELYLFRLKDAQLNSSNAP